MGKFRYVEYYESDNAAGFWAVSRTYVIGHCFDRIDPVIYWGA